MTIVVGLFERPQDAERAITALESAGFVQDEISALAQDRIIKEHLDEQEIEQVEVTTGLGAIGGSAIGGLAGLLAGVGVIAIPGIGPVLAAGALASTLAGVVVGGSAGGLVGALVGMGLPGEDANFYAEGVKRQGVLIAVQSEGGHTSLAESIMKQANALDVDTRRKAWLKNGWVGFDESSEPDAGYPTVWLHPGQ
jgi:hypothetical protein